MAKRTGAGEMLRRAEEAIGIVFARVSRPLFIQHGSWQSSIRGSKSTGLRLLL